MHVARLTCSQTLNKYLIAVLQYWDTVAAYILATAAVHCTSRTRDRFRASMLWAKEESTSLCLYSFSAC